MSVDEGKRLKELENENARLKKIVAEQTLMIDGLKDLSKKTGNAICAKKGGKALGCHQRIQCSNGV
jgi:hypothetical protein